MLCSLPHPPCIVVHEVVLNSPLVGPLGILNAFLQVSSRYTETCPLNWRQFHKMYVCMYICMDLTFVIQGYWLGKPGCVCSRWHCHCHWCKTGLFVYIPLGPDVQMNPIWSVWRQSYIWERAPSGQVVIVFMLGCVFPPEGGVGWDKEQWRWSDLPRCERGTAL